MRPVAMRAPAALAVAALLCGGPALAHHTSAPTGRSIELTSRAPAASLRLSALGTGLSAGGELYSLELDGQVGFAERFVARLRAPFHYLAHHGEEQMGPGDMTLGGEVLFVAGRLRLSVGSDLELPTGDADTGLGHGALTLAPLVAAHVRIGAGVRALAQASVLVDLTDSSSEDLVEQQDSVELRAVGGALWEHGAVSAAGLVRLARPLSSDDEGESFTTAAVVTELALSHRTRASLFAEFPLAGDRRIDWRAGLAFGVSLH
jgi:hypothetical protein